MRFVLDIAHHSSALAPSAPLQGTIGRMDSPRSKDALTFTAMGALAFGVGLFLFAVDMRTVGAPAEHVLIAESFVALLAVVAVAAGVPAIIMRVQAARESRGDY